MITHFLANNNGGGGGRRIKKIFSSPHTNVNIYREKEFQRRVPTWIKHNFRKASIYLNNNNKAHSAQCCYYFLYLTFIYLF